MTKQQLVEQIFLKRSFLCVGLDTDVSKIPAYLKSAPDPVFEFNRQIIDATKSYCIAYKLNTAFYEVLGSKGWDIMERTVNYIPSTHFKIADAKRGDIGNTSDQYARAFFDTLKFDAVTVAPYMGEDSIRPFLEHRDKWTIVLALTSNSGAKDFEMQQLSPANIGLLAEPVPYKTFEGLYLYEKILYETSKWGTPENLMFVTGATRPHELLSIRKIIPGNFLLVPGVGFQGGSLSEVCNAAITKECGLIVNVSRAIIYAGENDDFAEEAGAIAQQYQFQMAGHLTDIKTI